MILGCYIHFHKQYFYHFDLKGFLLGLMAYTVWYFSAIGIAFWRKVVFSEQTSNAPLLFIGIVIGIFSFKFIGKGTQIFAVAKRAMKLSADEVIAVSEKKPILYLRSFDRDKEQAPSKYSLRERENAHFYWNIWNPALWNERRNFSLEEVICMGIGYNRPVIAIGQPGEKLPQLGAFRKYVDNHKWKDTVISFISKSCFVCLLIGHSAGLSWESNYILKNIDLCRLLLLIPQNFSDYGWNEFYDRLSDENKFKLPVKLPQNTVAIFFNTYKKPIVITGDNIIPIYKSIIEYMEKDFPTCDRL